MKEFLIGFRKFTVAVLFLGVAVILLLAGIIPAADWLKHVSTVVVAFMGTNIGEHLLGVTKEWINAKQTNM